jgi:hypothetical protein
MQIFSFFVFGPLQEIGNILLSYREAEASLNNFQNLMNKAPESQPADPKHLGDIQTSNFKPSVLNIRLRVKRQSTILDLVLGRAKRLHLLAHRVRGKRP